MELSEKLRDGSEAPCARALQAVCRLARDAPGAPDEFSRAAAALRAADAKHRLGFALICAAEIDIERGRFGEARDKAAEALRLVTVLGRASEIAAAHALLARAAVADNDHCVVRQHAAAMRKSLARPISCWAQTLAESVLESHDEPPAGGRVSMARRSAKVRP